MKIGDLRGEMEADTDKVMDRYAGRRRKKPDRGVALVMVLFVIFIEAVLGFSAISIATLDSRTVTAEYLSTQALYLARAGVARACAGLQSSGSWTPSNPYSLQGGTYTISMSWPSSGTNCLVSSTGTYQTSVRTVQAWLEPEGYSKYAYFTNSETGSSGQTIWFINGDHISGSAHTNGFFSMQGNPAFSADLSSSNVGDSYYSTNPLRYSQSGAQTSPANPAQFYHYSTNYATDGPVAYNNSPSFSFLGGQTQVALPASATAAQANATNNYTGTTTITFNSNGTATVAQYGKSNVTINTTPTATIYVNGQVNTSGTVHGSVTLASNNTINVTSNLVYSNKASDVLGLLTTGTIQVNTSSSGNFEIDASIMALSGSFTVANYDSGSPRGVLTIYGGIIQQNRGPVGTSNNGTLATGYTKNYTYDQKLVRMQPPNFPTTLYWIVNSYTDMGSLGT